MSALKKAGALGLLVLGAGLAAVGQPTTARRLRWMKAELEKQIRDREVQIDPGELLDLRFNRGLRLFMFDVRSETDYNLFHIVGAERVPMDEIGMDFVKKYPPEAVKVVMSNDEKAATEAWKLLRASGMENVYILAGGINFWLKVFRDHQYDAKVPVPPDPSDKLRYRFDMALCDCFIHYYPYGNPNPHHIPKKRKYTKKVKIKVVKPPSGGCGA